MDGITGAVFVVGLRVFIAEPANVYRIEATVQVKVLGASLYEEHVERFNTWADVVSWLGTLLPAGVATATVDSLLSTFRES